MTFPRSYEDMFEKIPASSLKAGQWIRPSAGGGVIECFNIQSILEGKDGKILVIYDGGSQTFWHDTLVKVMSDEGRERLKAIHKMEIKFIVVVTAIAAIAVTTVWITYLLW